MKAEEFEEHLTRFKHREPFYPFVVELNDGRALLIGTPTIVFCAGVATHVTPEFDFVEFASEDVRAMRFAVPEPTA